MMLMLLMGVVNVIIELMVLKIVFVKCGLICGIMMVNIFGFSLLFMKFIVNMFLRIKISCGMISKVI